MLATGIGVIAFVQSEVGREAGYGMSPLLLESKGSDVVKGVKYKSQEHYSDNSIQLKQVISQCILQDSSNSYEVWKKITYLHSNQFKEILSCQLITQLHIALPLTHRNVASPYRS